MTNTPAKPPREFLILYRESNRMFNSYRIDDSQLANEHLNDQTYRNAGIPQREAIHVIEKSYADRMEQELAFVKTQWKQTSDLLEQERNRLTAELAEMRKERDAANERLRMIHAAQSTHAHPDSGIRIELLNHEINRLHTENKHLRTKVLNPLAVAEADERDQALSQAAALAGALDEILNVGNGFSCEYTEAQAERGEMELATYREFLKGRE